MNSLKTQRMAGRARATIATVAATALALSPINMRAGDLNTEVNNMFNSLGAIGNYTAPGAFRGQTFNTYTGGSLFMRAPNKVYQLAAIQFPSAKAGCGGIDVFGGSFSHISAAEFKNMLRNITAALPGIAFQLEIIKCRIVDHTRGIDHKAAHAVGEPAADGEDDIREFDGRRHKGRP